MRLIRQKPLLFILVLGGVLRLVWLVAMWGAPLRSDEREYIALAQAVQHGGYVDDGRWLRPPLFPLWLALTRIIGSNSTNESTQLLVAHLAQCALGVAFVGIMYGVTFAAWHNRRMAYGAAFIAAIYLPLIGYSYYLMADMLLLVLLGGVAWVLFASIHRPTLRKTIAAGVLLGMALLTKPIAIACVPALGAALWQGHRTWQPRIMHIAVALLCSGIIIAPWSIRNALVHHRFIPLDTTAGYNLWFGNRPPNEGGTLFEHHMQTDYPNVADRNAAYMQRAWQNMQHNPLDTLQRMRQKMGQLWRTQADALLTEQDVDLVIACPRSQSHTTIIGHGDHIGTVVPVCWWQSLSLLADVVYLPMLVGIMIALLWHHQQQRWVVALMVTSSWVMSFYAATVVTLVQTRLRLPLLPILLPYAANGLVQLLSFRQRRSKHTQKSRIQRTGVPFFTHWRVGVALLLVLWGAWGLRVVPYGASQLATTMAQRAWHNGIPQQALQYYQYALAWYPTRMDVLRAAGQTAETLGYDKKALLYYNTAIHLVNYDIQARIGAARILARQGHMDAAHNMLAGTSLSQQQREHAAFAAAIIPAHTYLDIGTSAIAEYGYLVGFYPTENITTTVTHATTATTTFRWTGDTAVIRLGTMPTSHTTILRMRLSTSRPQGIPPPHIGLMLNATTNATAPTMMDTTLAPGWWRVYSIVAPPAQSGVMLTMHTDTISETRINPHDSSEREVGVAVDWVRHVQTVTNK